MSFNRHATPFNRYSDSPERYNLRVIVICEYSVGRMFFVLLMVRDTSAICCAERWLVPLKITFSIFSDRRALVFCSPSTQRIASTTLDLRQPLGPTIPVIPSSKLMTILSAKLLNPLISNFDNCMRSVVDLCSLDVSTPICKN